MPTVQRYGAPRVETTALPGVRQSPNAPIEAFGGGQAAQQIPDLGGVTQVIARIAADERNKANQVAVLDADSRLSAAETTILYDQKNGVLVRKGKDAFDAPTQAADSWNKTVSEIETGLTNDDQRLAFRKMVVSRQGDLNRTIQSHVAGERKAYDDQTTESWLTNERDAAIQNYHDPERITLSLERQRGVIATYAARNGLPDEYTHAKIGDAQSKTHLGVLSRMLGNNEDLTAKAYYTQHKDELLGSDAINVEKSLAEGSLRGESQRQSDAILAKTPDRASALAQARQITDPEVRDAAEARVNQYFTEQRAARNEQQEDLYLRSTNILDANAGRPARSVIPATIWSKLDLGQRTALERRAQGDGEGSNNDRAWLDFLDLPTTKVAGMTRAEFETKYWSKFDKSHRGRAETYWESAKHASEHTEQRNPELTASLTFKDRVQNTLRTSGLIDRTRPLTQMSNDQMGNYITFETEAAKRVEDFELGSLSGKRRATGEEVQAIVDDMVTKKVFIDKSWGRDPEKLTATLTVDERGKAYIPYDKIPTPDRNSISNLIKSKGRKVTTSKLERAYGAYVLGDRGLFNTIITEP